MIKYPKFFSLLIIIFISACQSFKPVDLDSSTLVVSDPDYQLDYAVYTPPNWTKSESLPILLFLHGARDNHTSFEKFKSHTYLDRQINAGNIPRLIIVSPDGKNGFWENWHDGSHNYRDWLVDQLLPHVSKQYNTLACPEHCHLAGISMGGFGALRIGSLKPTIFSSISAISAPIFNEEEQMQARESLITRLFFPLDNIFGPDTSENFAKNSIENHWLKNKELRNTRLQLIAGRNDSEQIIKSNNRFHSLLATHSIPHDYFIYDGGHKWKYWIPNLNRVINFSLNKSIPVK